MRQDKAGTPAPPEPKPKPERDVDDLIFREEKHQQVSDR